MKELEQRLQLAINKVDKLKALHQQRMMAARHRERVKARKERDRHIYKLGGMVEKMGLDQLPDDTFLGSLALINRNILKAEYFNRLTEDGQQFLDIGKKLSRPDLQKLIPVGLKVVSAETAQQEPMSSGGEA